MLYTDIILQADSTELRKAVSSAQSTSFESVLKQSGQEDWSYTK